MAQKEVPKKTHPLKGKNHPEPAVFLGFAFWAKPAFWAISFLEDQIQPKLGSLSPSAFWEHFERRYGANPAPSAAPKCLLVWKGTK